MGRATKAALLTQRLPEDDVELAGVGTVRVRGLNRDETVDVGQIDNLKERDRHIVAIGMVDPKLSVSEVKQWGAGSAGGEIEKVSRRITELSGMAPESEKEAYKSVRSPAGS